MNTAKQPRPRLRKRFGIWDCTGGGSLGYGYTPKQAYDDWQRRGLRVELRAFYIPDVHDDALVSSFPPLT